MSDRPDDEYEGFEVDHCDNCGDTGLVPGCFESTCSGTDCDPDDVDLCCAPNRCDWCFPSPTKSGLQQVLADALDGSISATGNPSDD